MHAERDRTPARALALAGLLLGACGGETHGREPAPDVLPAPWLAECARERGLVFEHRSGHAERHLFPEILGAGALLFDLDGDADLDAYLVQAGGLGVAPEERPGNRLFLNRGDGRFDDRTAGSGADDRGYGMGVAAGDVDGDGDADVYVTNLGPNVLLSNDGSARFSDGAGPASGGAAWSTSACFLDSDRDGDLDLFVANYVLWSPDDEIECQVPPLGNDYCSPKAYAAPAPDTLFENDGAGRLTDVSVRAGLRAAFGNGLGVIALDQDADGWEDVFVANDQSLNQLWRNRHDGTFEDRALLIGCAADDDGVPKAGMGVSAADVDHDGDEDLLVVNLAGESDSFYRNDGTHFSDRTAQVGLGLAGRPFTRFGCGLVDLDCDGVLDLYVANGRVARALAPPAADPYAEANLLLRGLPGGRFEPLPGDGTALALHATSRAAAFGDVDGDGGLDVLVANRDGPAHLYRNVHPERGACVRLRVLEMNGRDAYGATVAAQVGGRRVVRRVRSAHSYAAANDPAVHLGLGSHAEVRGVRVRWADGAEEGFGDLPAGGTVTLRRGAGD